MKIDRASDAHKPTPSSGSSDADKDLRRAKIAQRDRAIGFALSALCAVPASLAGALNIRFVPSLVLLAIGLASTVVFTRLAVRAHRAHTRLPRMIWWLVTDIVLITLIVPLTGGVQSPWWIWYLASMGSAAAYRGRRFAVLASVVMAASCFGVLLATGEIHGFHHGFYLVLSRFVFLGAAATPLLLNVVRMRENGAVIRRLRDEAQEAAAELRMANDGLKEAVDMLRELSLTDGLTNLRNRRYLAERVADEVARQEGRLVEDTRLGTMGAGFLVLDLDHFKPINDTYGHAAGDAALQHVASVLRTSVRTEDTVARLGGDEFAIFLPQVSEEALPAVAAKVAGALRSQPARLAPGISQMLSFSIGWAYVSPRDRARGQEAFDETMSMADGALYEAKEAGRNCIRGAVHGTTPAAVAKSLTASERGERHVG